MNTSLLITKNTHLPINYKVKIRPNISVQNAVKVNFIMNFESISQNPHRLEKTKYSGVFGLYTEFSN